MSSWVDATPPIPAIASRRADRCRPFWTGTPMTKSLGSHPPPGLGPDGPARTAIAWPAVGGVAFAVSAVLVAVSARYGYHRDELYLPAGRDEPAGAGQSGPGADLGAGAVATGSRSLRKWSIARALIAVLAPASSRSTESKRGVAIHLLATRSPPRGNTAAVRPVRTVRGGAPRARGRSLSLRHRRHARARR